MIKNFWINSIKIMNVKTTKLIYLSSVLIN